MACYLQLLRWNKPSGRLILLIPAGWSLWLTPKAPPSLYILGLIVFGGLFVSGVGCIANDIWDLRFDREVERTKDRPLANGKVSLKTAWVLLISLLFLSFSIVLLIPIESRIYAFNSRHYHYLLFFCIHQQKDGLNILNLFFLFVGAFQF